MRYTGKQAGGFIRVLALPTGTHTRIASGAVEEGKKQITLELNLPNARHLTMVTSSHSRASSWSLESYRESHSLHG